eukprot:4660074-Amphidinium_carterae.1
MQTYGSYSSNFAAFKFSNDDAWPKWSMQTSVALDISCFRRPLRESVLLPVRFKSFDHLPLNGV